MASRFPRIRSYELMVIFHPEVEEEALGELIESVRTYITDVDGTVTVVNRETPWGRRRLAYPIRHDGRDLRDGYYTLYYFDTEASRTVDIEREIKLNTRIIRHMLIQQSAPMMEPPVPVEQPAPAQEGAAPANPSVPSEASPGTPPEATPTPIEPMVADAAVVPLPGDTSTDLPTLDSTSEPALPSDLLPPTDVTLVELATMAAAAEEPASPTDVAPTEAAPIDPPVTAPEPATVESDLPMADAPPEAADLAQANTAPAVDSTDAPDEGQPTPAPTV